MHWILIPQKTKSDVFSGIDFDPSPAQHFLFLGFSIFFSNLFIYFKELKWKYNSKNKEQKQLAFHSPSSVFFKLKKKKIEITHSSKRINCSKAPDMQVHYKKLPFSFHIAHLEAIEFQHA